MIEQSSLKTLEQTRRKKAAFITITITVFILVSIVISMNSGFLRLGPFQVFQTLFGSGTPQQELILFKLRLPRVALSLLIGAGLAVSGTIMQGVTRNDLAVPGLIGITSGAGLAVVIFISFFQTESAASVFALPLMAFIGAAGTAALVVILSYRKHEGVLPSRLILMGIAAAAGISSVMLVLTVKLNPYQLQFVTKWLAGSIWGSNWLYVLALLPWISILTPYAIIKARTLNILYLGDAMAIGLGLSANRERSKLIGAAVGLAGSSVAVGGGIGFVGLIAPHLSRRLVGAQHQYLLPVSALIGSLLVLFADTLARVVFQPIEFPTGIVIGVIGAPYFLYLLIRQV